MDQSQIIPEIVRVLRLEGEAILSCADRLSQGTRAEGFLRAIEWAGQSLDRGGKIVVTGIGKSGKVGQKIAATLCSTGSLALYLHPTEGLHGDLGLIRTGDVVLALSYTGNTEEVVRLLPLLKSRGAKVVGILGNLHSQFAQECDAWIDAAVEKEACPHHLAPTTSTTLALALGDAFALALMQLRGFKAEDFAQNHPGGSIGKKLTLKVCDLMIPFEKVACVGIDATMAEVIDVSTQKHQGAVLVLDGQRLLGLITDGDLRRALKHREQFFQMKASEVMTRNPIVASADLLARQALDLMENRQTQIAVIPVVHTGDQKNEQEHPLILGLLRLHDLVRTF